MADPIQQNIKSKKQKFTKRKTYSTKFCFYDILNFLDDKKKAIVKDYPVRVSRD